MLRFHVKIEAEQLFPLNNGQGGVQRVRAGAKIDHVTPRQRRDVAE
jgi:hypothetical protein